MIEVSINYETFGLTTEQLHELNALLAEVKLRSGRNGSMEFKDHTKQIEAVVTTRWKGDE